MRKLAIITFSAAFIFGVMFFSSCKRGNSSENAVAKQDTLVIPQLKVVTDQIKKDSLNPFLYFKRAHISEANKDFKGAIADMHEALRLDSLRPEFYLYAADLFKESGQLLTGISLMNKAITTDSMNTKFYVKAAELAFIDTTIHGHASMAMAYLNAAIVKNPQDAEIYFYKGAVYKESGDTARAISSFQTATELDPKFYNAYVQIGLLLEQKKDKNAEKYLDNAIKVSDKPEDALYAKANIYKKEGVQLEDDNQQDKAVDKFETAIENFKQVIDLDHRNVEAYMGIAYSYYQMDSVQDAYKYYDLATRIEPTYAGAYFSKGLCAEELGHRQEAIAMYNNCLNIDPTFKPALEHLKKLQPQ